MITKSQIIQQKYTAATYPNRGLTFVKGERSYLITESGDRYLDMMTNYGVNILGYSQTAIVQCIRKQVNQLPSVNHSFNNPTRSDVSQKLIAAIGIPRLSRVFWSSSGTEAVEAALKFAAIHTGKTRFLSARGSYHGKTLGSLSVTSAGDGKYQKPFQSMLSENDQFAFGNINSLSSAISKKHAAVILEPIQGEAGVVVPPPDFLQSVSTLCRKNNTLLIVDEIQTGLGRTGSFLHIHQHKGVVPDIVCLSKGLGYGVPVGATVISEKINRSLSKGIHTSTFGGNPISLSAAGGVISYLSEHSDLSRRVQTKGKRLMKGIQDCARSYPHIISRVDGAGLMIGVETSIDPMILIRALQMRKILVAPTSLNRFRLLPPLIIANQDIDRFVRTLKKVLEETNV